MLKTPMPPERQKRIEDARSNPLSSDRLESSETVFCGFTHSELFDAFTLVEDLDHWKNPITAVIHAEDWMVVDAAVAYFTGGPIHPVVNENLKEGWISVWAPGYYISMPGG